MAEQIIVFCHLIDKGTAASRMTAEVTMARYGAHIRYPSFSQSIIIIVGGFGSGKTEISVNLATYLESDKKSQVTIVDLDLVNPYFRSREALADMEKHGIRALVPRGGQFYADLPILLPEIKGAIDKVDGRLILDVGGDSQGARALGSLSAEFVAGRYDMLMVLNSRRPLTENIAGCIKTMRRIETTSKLSFTGLISNSHMIDETDEVIVREGYELAQEVSRETGLPLVFVSAKSDVIDRLDQTQYDCPFLPLSRMMLKPWERRRDTTDHS